MVGELIVRFIYNTAEVRTYAFELIAKVIGSLAARYMGVDIVGGATGFTIVVLFLHSVNMPEKHECD